MKVLSFTDILKASWLQGYNQFDLLSIEMDEAVDKVLYTCGLDTDYAIVYYPCKHRTLEGKVVIGYVAAGEVRCDREFLTGPYADLTDIIAAATYTDRSLAEELASFSRSTTDFTADKDRESMLSGRPIIPDEDDCETVTSQIEQLQEIIDYVRGPSLGKDGSYKTREEYQEYYQERLKGVA